MFIHIYIYTYLCQGSRGIDSVTSFEAQALRSRNTKTRAPLGLRRWSGVHGTRRHHIHRTHDWSYWTNDRMIVTFLEWHEHIYIYIYICIKYIYIYIYLHLRVHPFGTCWEWTGRTARPGPVWPAGEMFASEDGGEFGGWRWLDSNFWGLQKWGSAIFGDVIFKGNRIILHPTLLYLRFKIVDSSVWVSEMGCNLWR